MVLDDAIKRARNGTEGAVCYPSTATTVPFLEGKSLCIIPPPINLCEETVWSS